MWIQCLNIPVFFEGLGTEGGEPGIFSKKEFMGGWGEIRIPVGVVCC